MRNLGISRQKESPPGVRNRRPRVPFDKAQYLAEGKTTPAAILLRSVKTLRDLDEKYPDCKYRKNVLNAIKKNIPLLRAAHLSESAEKVCRALERGKLGRIRQTDLLTLEAQARYEKTPKNVETVGDAIRQISEFKRDYDKRGFFEKFFVPSAHRQSRAIERMKAELIAKGVSGEALDRAITQGAAQDQAGLAQTLAQISDSMLHDQMPPDMTGWEVMEVPEAAEEAVRPEPAANVPEPQAERVAEVEQNQPERAQ